jgi:hypothetical protein
MLSSGLRLKVALGTFRFRSIELILCGWATYKPRLWSRSRLRVWGRSRTTSRLLSATSDVQCHTFAIPSVCFISPVYAYLSSRMPHDAGSFMPNHHRRHQKTPLQTPTHLAISITTPPSSGVSLFPCRICRDTAPRGTTFSKSRADSGTARAFDSSGLRSSRFVSLTPMISLRSLRGSL